MAETVSHATYAPKLLAMRLAKAVSLSASEREFLTTHQQKAQLYRAGSELNPAPAAYAAPKVIVSGWANRQRILPNGRCQLLSVLLPGDLIGCDPERPLEMESVVAVNTVRAISAAPIYARIAACPDEYSGIAAGLAALKRAEETRILNSMARLGFQPALERTANLLGELFVRCEAIGFVIDNAFAMPLTQEMLANALGLSPVHVNRILALLRRNGLINAANGVVRITNARELARFADLMPEFTEPACDLKSRHYRALFG